MNIEIKSMNADGTFEGFASLFGEEDLGRDVIEPGAFRDSLNTRGTSGIKMLFQHDPNQPIGVWEELKELPRGLYARGRLMIDVARAREVLSLMIAGALDGLSIGFRTIKARKDANGSVRHIEKVDLWEISVVTFPMQPLARVSAVKHHGSFNEINDTTLALRILQAAQMFKTPTPKGK
jgi:Escherichia/Staphylococcus phage prohead protease